MLRKKTPPVQLKFVLSIPKSLADRIENVRRIAEQQGYELDIDETLSRCITSGVTRWEKVLGIGSNAAAVKKAGAGKAGERGTLQPPEVEPSSEFVGSR